MDNSKKYYTIDRIEENIAICYDDYENKFEIHIGELYNNPKESDVFIKFKNSYLLQNDETQKRKKENLNLFKKITKRK